jgi:hypothetical protein
LIPATEPPTKKESIDLLDYFLDFMSNKTTKFLFWFNLLKDKYLRTFYPNKFQELRLQDKYDGINIIRDSYFQRAALRLNALPKYKLAWFKD